MFARTGRGKRWLALLGSVAVAVPLGLGTAALPAVAAECDGMNAIVCENNKPGDDPGVWDISRGWGAGDDSIQGFATAMSVNPGQTIQFKVKARTNLPYTIDVYRLGYYGGKGARRQAPTITVNNPASQPACISDSATHNFDCGNWSVSSQWGVPSSAVSGVYIATLNQGEDRSQITFVVRNDASHSDVLFKTSDATWQAYNQYGGADFYGAPSSLTGSQARAFKISYNRPFATRGTSEGRDFLFANEYPTLRFLERNGIDVSYTTDIDVSIGTSVLTNHKAFLSVGHDEYWTRPERTRVEAARDAGVNMMFLSGNEVYWRTRLEPSIDGTSTPNRTLVCYKDSWDGTKIDPGPEATATWRDARFGSEPENALTGTIYMSNFTDLPITVSAAQGKARLWRGTSLVSLPSGGSAQLAPHTVGYESDEDLDNGARPAGLMRLSTTVGPTEQLVVNQAGTQVAPGTTTHSLTLYRAPSGALVFGAGTVQWGWALDQYHDGDNSNAPDSRIQQATLNMLADMGVMPTTLMAGLVMPAKSTDTQPPTVTVTSPAAGATIGNGSMVTVTGTTAEAGGGVVTSVEVSLDGGATYRRATGTASWSYTGVLSGVGAASIKVRATDDSANLSAPKSVSVTVSCPCSLFGQTVPSIPATSDAGAVELGVKFVPEADGFISGIRFYKGTGNTGTHTGTLWTSTGTALAVGTFTNESSSGWQTLTLPSAVSVSAGTTYVASYFAPNGHYAADPGFFTSSDFRAPPLKAPGQPSGVANGVYANGHAFPSSSWGDTNYWVDVVYTRDDTTPPSVSVLSPLSGASSVATTVKPSATFAGTVDPASVTLVLKTSGGQAVAGSASFDAASRTVRFTPNAPLAYGATYTATVNATSAAGVPMGAPVSWSFKTALTDPLPGMCPCTIWPDSATPATLADPDQGSVELGVKFTAEVDGNVAGVRFYKGPENLGTHTGSLWTESGALLGTVTFTGESSSGWQTAYFSSPIDVTAGTTYVVSYRAPFGRYSYTANGLAAAVDSPPLHTVPQGGVYTYGSGAPLSSSNANYWVDVVFNATDAAPMVASTTPGASATNVNLGADVTARFSAQIKAGTGTMVLKRPDGTDVLGTVTYDAPTRTMKLAPSTPLTAGTTYTATVSGATALSGYVMEPYTWTFTTAGIGACPCTLFESTAVPSIVDSGDGSGVELGVAFEPTAAGMITGVRFYKGALNTGTHTGSLWASDGTRLATGTFTGESSSGWQTLMFAQPVAVSPDKTYVASYHAPGGHYSATSGFFSDPYSNGPLAAVSPNGRYQYGSASAFPTNTWGAANYWVDPIFMTGAPPDSTPPVVSSTAPLADSSSRPTDTAVSATFAEDVTPTSVSVELRPASGGAPITGTTAYSAAIRTVTFTPGTALARGVAYRASVTATDLAGNVMSEPHTWSFTTVKPDPTPGVCPCSIWTDATTPTTVDDDPRSVELGTAFTADEAGRIAGVRFHKGAGNTGTHTVSLWDQSGTRLATTTVTNESSEGWQTATFAAPVAITAGQTYIVSYLAPNGRFSLTLGGLSTAIDAPPLHTVATGGRYLYGTGGFPTVTSNSNYWVDPVFDTSGSPPPADTTPPVVTAVTATPGGTVTWTTDESATSVVAYGTTTALGSTATGTSGTSHSVTLPGLAQGTTYYYRVTSADAAGNSTTSPAPTAAPVSFTTNDTTAPAITAVAVTGSGTTRTVTWTTNESATSVVSYGTTTALGSTATGTSGTSHSVTLSGLTQGTTYYYRVTSVDPAGNSASSPASPAAPATFATADTTAPVISAVTATGSGTTATVTWTTDESSSSVVSYGTTTALGSTASGPAGTSHSVTLNGLARNTRYYYRVTSADSAGNSATAPATGTSPAAYAPTVAPISHTTAADFSGSGGYVADSAGGEIMAAPTLGSEFSGTTLATQWRTTSLGTGSTATVGGGAVTLNGRNLWSNSTYAAGRSLSSSVTLGAGQSVGWGSTALLSSNVKAAFVVDAAGNLSAVTVDGRTVNRTQAIAGSWTGAPHDYRVDWVSGSVTFFIDGAQVATSTFSPTVSLRYLAVDPAVAAPNLVVDWTRLGPWTATSTYTSGVVDAGAIVGWDSLVTDTRAVAGSAVAIQVRSGNTASPGSGWTGWTTVPANGTIIRSARYLQYRVVFTNTGTRFVSSATQSVQIGFHVL